MVPSIIAEKDWRRFWKYTRRNGETGCLEWVGTRVQSGHGEFWLSGKLYLAHRVAFVTAGGVLTEEKPHVLHRCDNPPCCEYGHLYAGTDADNHIDMAARWRGNKSKLGRLFGARPRPNGRYASEIRWRGRNIYLGDYDSEAEASAVAVAAKMARVAEALQCRGD